jgi:hypothetical protein
MDVEVNEIVGHDRLQAPWNGPIIADGSRERAIPRAEGMRERRHYVDEPCHEGYNTVHVWNMRWRNFMADHPSYTWNPNDIVELTNVSNENFLIELASGSQRLDAGRTTRFTASALDLPQVVTLINAGKLRAEASKRKKYPWQLRSSS